MWLLTKRYDLTLDIPFKSLFILALLIASILLLLPAVLNFYRRHTTVNPLKPESTSSLVVDGVYRFSRNPMYLGMALALFSWVFYLANPLNIIFFGFYIFYMTEFQIKFEEKALLNLFGQDFKHYMKKVRRWI